MSTPPGENDEANESLNALAIVENHDKVIMPCFPANLLSS